MKKEQGSPHHSKEKNVLQTKRESLRILQRMGSWGAAFPTRSLFWGAIGEQSAEEGVGEFDGEAVLIDGDGVYFREIRELGPGGVDDEEIAVGTVIPA